MYRNNQKLKIYLSLMLLIPLLTQTGISYAALSQKALDAERKVMTNPTGETVSNYTKIMMKEYKRAKKAGANDEAADCLRAALYFLKQNPNSADYIDAKAKLDELLSKTGADTSQASRLELAKAMYLENNVFAAAYEFSSLLKENYETDVCYEYLGDIALKLNSSDVAFSFYKKAVETNPENYNAKFKYANALLDRGNKGDAILYYEEVIENTKSSKVINEIINKFTQRLNKNQNDEINYGILGLAYQRLGEYNKTYQLLRKSLIINPNDIFLRYYLGNLLFDIKEYSFADEIYTEILEENPYESQIRISRAKAYIAKGETDKAIKDYQIVLAMYPDSLQAQYGMYSMLKGKRSLDEIINLFYPIEPDYKLKAEKYDNLGYFANKFGKTEDAKVFFEKSLALNPKSEVPYIELYKIYQLLGQDTNAKNILEKGYKAFPKNKEILDLYSVSTSDKTDEKNKLALSYLNEGEYKKAISVYEQVVPKKADTYEAIGNCYRQLGDFKNAVLNYKKSIEIDSNNSDTYYALGIAYLEANKQDKAKEAFKTSLQKDAKNIKSKKMLSFIEQNEVSASLDLAYNYYDKGDYQRALISLNKAVQTFPKDPKVYYYRGLTKEAMGDFKGAVTDLKQTIALDRNYFSAYFKLGENLEKIHKEKEALMMYEKYLGAESTDKEFAKIAQQRIVELGEKYY